MTSDTRLWFRLNAEGIMTGPFLRMPSDVDVLGGEKLFSVIASDMSSELRSSWDPNWRRWT